MRKAVRSTRASRRVFAKKSMPTLGNVKYTFLRGGGYL